MSEKVVGPATYITIFIALCVFTLITAWVAFIDLGPLNNVVAMGIAFTKAMLVILFFMHVKYSDRLIWITALSGFYWLVVLLLITYSDYWSRGWKL